MIEILGWLAVIFVGAKVCFVVSCRFFDAVWPTGLEGIPLMLICGGATSVVWITVMLWLSPIALSITVQ